MWLFRHLLWNSQNTGLQEKSKAVNELTVLFFPRWNPCQSADFLTESFVRYLNAFFKIFIPKSFSMRVHVITLKPSFITSSFELHCKLECYHLHKSLTWVFGIGLNRKRFQRKTLKRRGLNIELHGTTFSKFFHLLKVVYFYLLFPMIQIKFCYQKRMCKTKLILFLLSRYLFHFSIITSKVCCAFWPFRNPHWYLQNIGSENISNCLKSQFFKNFKDHKQNTDRPVFLFINSRLFLKSWFDSWRLRVWENLNVVKPSLKWYILNSEKKNHGLPGLF